MKPTLITGAPGTGKTELMRAMIQRRNPSMINTSFFDWESGDEHLNLSGINAIGIDSITTNGALLGIISLVESHPHCEFICCTQLQPYELITKVKSSFRLISIH